MSWMVEILLPNQITQRHKGWNPVNNRSHTDDTVSDRRNVHEGGMDSTAAGFQDFSHSVTFKVFHFISMYQFSHFEFELIIPIIMFPHHIVGRLQNNANISLLDIWTKTYAKSTISIALLKKNNPEIWLETSLLCLAKYYNSLYNVYNRWLFIQTWEIDSLNSDQCDRPKLFSFDHSIQLS